MNNLKLLFQSIWHRTQTWLIHLKSKNIIKCGKCHTFLHCPRNPVGISHSLCLKCAYKGLGGTIPRLPTLRDFKMYKTLFSLSQEVHDSIWSGQKIYEGLYKSGQIQDKAKSENRSLDAEERAKIKIVRDVAYEHGYNRQYINHVEMIGAGYFKA